MSHLWQKMENEAGYPYYVDNRTSKQQYDHPEFQTILGNLKKYNEIKYSAYRTAFKIYCLQNQLKVPPLRICSGVLAHHQLSLSESSLSLDATELEAVLADIYFAAEKEGLFNGNVDLAVDLLLNLLLNVYDRERKEPVRVLAAKTLLILLSEESTVDKWVALAHCAADHNGCVSPRRLATLLAHVVALPAYLGEDLDQHIQEDVDECFAKSAGMLGVNARWMAEWAASSCSSARWMPVLLRIHSSRMQPSGGSKCAACGVTIAQVLKFKCANCNDVNFCENCYLYDSNIGNVSGHKKKHLVQEIIDSELPKSQCLGFIKKVKNFFFCTKPKRKRSSKKKGKKQPVEAEKGAEVSGTLRRRKDGRPAMFTSTVGKASGHVASNPATLLQDIINQLENQNTALQQLSSQLEVQTRDCDHNMKSQVDSHWGQIATQINRLKILKDNLSQAASEVPVDTQKHKENSEKIQAFDIFSPILREEKQSKVTEDAKSQPRVLSLDSGNFSEVSKQPDGAPLMTVSGDAWRPVVLQATSDSISTVSMNEISSWYNDAESIAPDKRVKQSDRIQTAEELTALAPGSDSLCVTEQRYDADLRSVASSNHKMMEINADLDTVLNRLQQILTRNFTMDDSCFDNTQLRETANEMEGLLGTLIRGVEQRATLNAAKTMV